MMTLNRIQTLLVAAILLAGLPDFAPAQSSASSGDTGSSSVDQLDPSLVESELIEGAGGAERVEPVQTAANIQPKQESSYRSATPIQQDSFDRNSTGSFSEPITKQRQFTQPVVDQSNFGQSGFTGNNVFESETEYAVPPAPRGYQEHDPVQNTVPRGDQRAITSLPRNNGTMIEQQIAPTIQTQIMAPRMINVNQPAQIYLQTQNVGPSHVKSVRLIVQLPDHVKFEGSNPLPSNVNGQNYEFTLTNFSSRARKIVRINVVPTAKLPLNIATQIQTEIQQQFAVAVQQPVLDIAINGPQAIQTGQEVKHTITVKNIGDGPAENIRIKPLLPDNLQFASNQKTLVPSLVPGQATKFVLSSFARSSGDSNVVFQVSASGIEARETRSHLRVIRPELGVQILGPSQNYLGREGIYSIQLDNASELPISDVDVTMRVPEGLKVTTISQQAKVDHVAGTLTWQFPDVGGNQKHMIQFKADAIKTGNHAFDVMVTSKEIGSKQLALVTSVQGRADLSLRLSDGGAPVGIGSKSEFTIEVSNHGSTDANQVNVVIQLPEALMAVTQEDYTIDASGSLIQFNTIDIAPGKTKTLKFKIVAVSEGEHIVRGTVSIEGSAQTISSENSIFVFESQNAKVSEALTPEINR